MHRVPVLVERARTDRMRYLVNAKRKDHVIYACSVAARLWLLDTSGAIVCVVYESRPKSFHMWAIISKP